MTEFQQKFFLEYLGAMHSILSDETKIIQAIAAFTQGKESPTYFNNSSISDVDQWGDDDKLALNAALFEAHAQTVYKMVEDNSDLLYASNTPCDEVQTNCLLQLTQNTVPNNRLSSVKSNIANLLETKRQEFQPVVYNPYYLFSAVAAGLVVVAAVAITMKP